MFCVKCGKELPENGVCSCQQQDAQTEDVAAQAQENGSPANLFGGFSLIRIVTLAIAVLTFLFHFINWYSASVKGSMLGITYSESEGIGAYESGIGDLSGMLGFTKVLLILNIIVFIAYMVTEFVDVKKFVPALANLKFDISKLASLAFYGLMAIALVFGLIGTFTVESVSSYGIESSFSISFGWVITFIFTAAGLVNIFMPELLKNLLDKVAKK